MTDALCPTAVPDPETDTPPFGLMLGLKERFHLRTFVEARTLGSIASEWAWGHFRRVLMVEPGQELSEWMARLRDPALVWLNGRQPENLLAQCEAIGSAQPEHVVMVDEARGLVGESKGDAPSLGQVLNALDCPRRRNAVVLDNAVIAVPVALLMQQVASSGLL